MSFSCLINYTEGHKTHKNSKNTIKKKTNIETILIISPFYKN